MKRKFLNYSHKKMLIGKVLINHYSGLYLFGVSRIKMDERDIVICLIQKKEQSQKEYGIGIRYGEKRIGIYKKHEMIYIVCPPDQGDDRKVYLYLFFSNNLKVRYLLSKHHTSRNRLHRFADHLSCICLNNNPLGVPYHSFLPHS